MQWAWGDTLVSFIFMSSSGDSSMYNNVKAIVFNDIDKEALFPSLLCHPLKKCTVEAERTETQTDKCHKLFQVL